MGTAFTREEYNRHFLTDVVSLHRHGQRIDRCRYARRRQYVLKLVPLNFRAE
jgi:hypothetical protein